MALWIDVCKRQKSTSDRESTLTLKSMGRIISSPKQKVPVAPQDQPLTQEKILHLQIKSQNLAAKFTYILTLFG